MDWNGFQDDTTVPAGPGAVDVTGGQQPQPGQNFASMMSPTTAFEAAHRASTSPQETQDRKTGWMKIAESYQNNPNLQRALMLVGTQLMQPIQPGQTTQGAIGNAAVVGMNAYQLGQQQELKQKSALRQEGREDTRLNLESERLGLERDRFGEQQKMGELTRKSTLLDIDTKTKTQADDVRRGKALADKAVADVKDAQDNDGIKKAERALKEQELRVKQSIPDETRQQAELDKINDLRASLDLKKSQTRKYNAEAADSEALARMTPEQRAKAKGGSVSAEIQKEAMYQGQYDRIKAEKPDSPEIKGVSRDEYVAKRQSEGRRADASRQIGVLISAGFSMNDPEIIALREEVRGGTARAAGAIAPPAPGTGTGKTGTSRENPVPWPGEAAAVKLPPGTWMMGPDGIPRRKKAAAINPRDAR